MKLGRMHVVELNAITGPEYVVNFPTKGHWKANSKLSDIETGLDDLARVIKERSIKSIAIPPLGAGNGGLPWSDVEPLIRAKLAELPEVTVLLFTPSNADRHLTPEPVKMT
ncbi:ADP-ribose 1'-phosphate phophatase related protein [Actinosynnema pretiosum subsp. pretiosum]|nr:ADP-ribose 1'-phosphate phophatase related protein [Actinosynnema pretiosum subsp. pretiosum]